jgi:hypothetical protein
MGLDARVGRAVCATESGSDQARRGGDGAVVTDVAEVLGLASRASSRERWRALSGGLRKLERVREAWECCEERISCQRGP